MKPTNSLRQYASYMNWVFNPFHGLDTSGVYDLLSTTSATDNGLYLNLGYWKNADSIDEASDALARLVADAGTMTRRDIVLDCGFGFADQDMLWASEYEPSRIIGLNITRSQVDVARGRVEAAGLCDCIDLRHGSATAIPLEPASVDLVVSLESAFHYRTREAFFQEAWRVLRPGGRIVTADIIPAPRAGQRRDRLRQWVSWKLVASKFVIPRENVYDAAGYIDRVAGAGFDEIRFESIRDDVYEPLHRFIAASPERLRKLHPIARIPARMAMRRDAAHVYAGLDYVLMSAIKPAGTAA